MWSPSKPKSEQLALPATPIAAEKPATRLLCLLVALIAPRPIKLSRTFCWGLPGDVVLHVVRGDGTCLLPRWPCRRGSSPAFRGERCHHARAVPEWRGLEIHPTDDRRIDRMRPRGAPDTSKRQPAALQHALG